MSDSLWAHGLQHTGFPVLNYLLEFAQTHVHWVNDAIVSSAVLFSCLQYFPASGSSPGRCSLHQVAKILELQASASVLSMNIQDWFPLGWTGWISLLSQGFPRGFSSTTVWKCQFFIIQPSLWSNSHIHCYIVISKKTVHGWYGGCVPQSPQGSWVLPANYPLVISLHNEISSST